MPAPSLHSKHGQTLLACLPGVEVPAVADGLQTPDLPGHHHPVPALLAGGGHTAALRLPCNTARHQHLAPPTRTTLQRRPALRTGGLEVEWTVSNIKNDFVV